MKDISSLKKLYHYPVMLNEVMEICKPEKGGLFVDCTYGAGGYSNSILSFPQTRVMEQKQWAIWWRHRITHGIKFGTWMGWFGE